MRRFPGQVVGRVIPTGMIPPEGPMTVSADRFAFDEAQHARRHPGPDVEMSRALLNGLRRVNITAAPPAHIKPHIWSEPVDQSGQATLAAAVVQPQTVLSFTNPPGRRTRITHYGVEVTDPTYTYDGTLLWWWRKNGRIIDQGMSGWGEQRGSMVFMRPTVIIMNADGDRVDFQVSRVGAGGFGALTTQMCFRGWTWRLRNNYEGTETSVTAY